MDYYGGGSLDGIQLHNQSKYCGTRPTSSTPSDDSPGSSRSIIRTPLTKDNFHMKLADAASLAADLKVRRAARRADKVTAASAANVPAPLADTRARMMMAAGCNDRVYDVRGRVCCEGVDVSTISGQCGFGLARGGQYLMSRALQSADKAKSGGKSNATLNGQDDEEGLATAKRVADMRNLTAFRRPDPSLSSSSSPFQNDDAHSMGGKNTIPYPVHNGDVFVISDDKDDDSDDGGDEPGKHSSTLVEPDLETTYRDLVGESAAGGDDEDNAMSEEAQGSQGSSESWQSVGLASPPGEEAKQGSS